MNYQRHHATTLCDRVFDLLERTEYRCAISDVDKTAIYRLRYDAYLREGAIEPNESRMFCDAYDASPNVWILGMHIDGELAASIRFHFASDERERIPACDVFGDILGPDLKLGRSVLDPTRFVANLEHARAFPEMPFLVLRTGMLAGGYFDPFYMLATVRTEHQAFYKRVFGYAPLSEARHYPSLKKPISCMALRYRERLHHVVEKYPFFGSCAEERDRLFCVPSNSGTPGPRYAAAAQRAVAR